MKNTQEEKIQSSEELQTKIREARRELSKMRLDLSLGRLKQTAQLKEKGREIARLETFARQRELSHLAIQKSDDSHVVEEKEEA